MLILMKLSDSLYVAMWACVFVCQEQKKVILYTNRHWILLKFFFELILCWKPRIKNRLSFNFLLERFMLSMATPPPSAASPGQNLLINYSLTGDRWLAKFSTFFLLHVCESDVCLWGDLKHRANRKLIGGNLGKLWKKNPTAIKPNFILALKSVWC